MDSNVITMIRQDTEQGSSKVERCGPFIRNVVPQFVVRLSLLLGLARYQVLQYQRSVRSSHPLPKV